MARGLVFGVASVAMYVQIFAAGGPHMRSTKRFGAGLICIVTGYPQLLLLQRPVGCN